MSGTDGLRQIRLFLVDGSPAGIIAADVVNWTGKVIAGPRARLDQLIEREEAERTGIYLLIGPDPDRTRGQKIYVGEADNIRKRLRRHELNDGMDFFDRLAFVVSKDENLTKAHSRFLESQIIGAIRDAGALALANATEPKFTGLPEADRADMIFFIDQLEKVLPLLGFDLFRVGGVQATQADDRSPLFELDAGGAMATAREGDNGFVVLANSTARKLESPSFPRGYKAFRDGLLADGKLIVDQDGLYKFAADIAFPSPTAAAAAVLARSASGPQEWLVKSNGETYRAWRQTKLGGGQQD
jgi:hypothetical protein